MRSWSRRANDESPKCYATQNTVQPRQHTRHASRLRGCNGGKNSYPTVSPWSRRRRCSGGASKGSLTNKYPVCFRFGDTPIILPSGFLSMLHTRRELLGHSLGDRLGGSNEERFPPLKYPGHSNPNDRLEVDNLAMTVPCADCHSIANHNLNRQKTTAKQ